MDVCHCQPYTESQMAILLRMTNDVREGYPARRAEHGIFLRSPLSIPIGTGEGLDTIVAKPA